MAKKQNTVISRHGRRIALRSPLAIESFELILNAETNELMLSMTILNTSTEENPSKVESAGLVIRCLDADGNLIGSFSADEVCKLSESGVYTAESVNHMGTSEDPCEMFSRIPFPAQEFSPTGCDDPDSRDNSYQTC